MKLYAPLAPEGHMISPRDPRGENGEALGLSTVGSVFQCKYTVLYESPRDYHIRYGQAYLKLPSKPGEAGNTSVCRQCKHQLSCLAGQVQNLRQEDLNNPEETD